MAQEFKNKYALNVGTSFVELYGPSGDMTYSIIVGLTVSNKMLNEILIDARIIDSTNVTTCYLCSDSKLSVGSTLLLAGDIQKIVLKPGDTIEIKSNEAASVDVTMAVMENDPSISYGGETPYPAWVGDLAFITGGDYNTTDTSTYTFSSDVGVVDAATLPYYIEYACSASNGVMGLILGGYTSSQQRTDTQSFLFSTQGWTAQWSYLGYDLRLGGGCSDGTTWFHMGGYTGSAVYNARTGSFDSGITATIWGNTRSAYFSCGAGNSVYACQLGGNNGSNNVDYFTYASQSNYTNWGQKRTTYNYVAACSNEEKMICHEGGSSTNLIEYFEFAAQSNYTSFGTLTGSNAQMGGVSDSIKGLFAGGQTANYGELLDMATGGVSTRITSLQDFNGQNPPAESGN